MIFRGEVLLALVAAIALVTTTTEPISPDVDFALGTLVDQAFWGP